MSVALDAILCDAPAKAFVKSVKLYSGYYGCDRCQQEGVYVEHRMTLVDSVRRTDFNFRLRQNPDHHLNAISPFERLLSVDMVNSFPHDYMHFICVGVGKKLLTNLTSAPVPYKVSSKKLHSISDILLSLRPHITSDFCRKPRSFEHIKKWKATEFRLIFFLFGTCFVF